MLSREYNLTCASGYHLFHNNHDFQTGNAIGTLGSIGMSYTRYSSHVTVTFGGANVMASTRLDCIDSKKNVTSSFLFTGKSFLTSDRRGP